MAVLRGGSGGRFDISVPYDNHKNCELNFASSLGSYLALLAGRSFHRGGTKYEHLDVCTVLLSRNSCRQRHRRARTYACLLFELEDHHEEMGQVRWLMRTALTSRDICKFPHSNQPGNRSQLIF